jgi:hypothetical protein
VDTLQYDDCPQQVSQSELKRALLFATSLELDTIWYRSDVLNCTSLHKSLLPQMLQRSELRESRPRTERLLG